MVGAAVPLVPALAVGEVEAFRGWCRADPIFRIGNQKLHLWVAVKWRQRREVDALMRGPIAVEVVVPVGIEAVRLDRNLGFGRRFDVSIRSDIDLLAKDGVIPLRFRVRIPFTEDVAARTWLRRLGTGPIGVAEARGRTNEWIDLLTD